MFKKFFEWKVPDFLEWHEWETWEANRRKDRPIGWFFHETLPDWWKALTDPITSIPYTIRLRYINRYDIIYTGLERGEYADGDQRLLHGAFQLLVDFVEIEKAHINIAWNGYKSENARWWQKRPFRFSALRDAQAGLDYLTWETTLDNPELAPENQSPHQALAAREIIALYNWWKLERPKRPDIHDVSGWSAYCNASERDIWVPTPDELKPEVHRMLEQMKTLEEQYDQEDTDYLTRLIKIRKSLWT